MGLSTRVWWWVLLVLLIQQQEPVIGALEAVVVADVARLWKIDGAKVWWCVKQTLLLYG